MNVPTRNCESANVNPHTSAAGQTAASAVLPPSTAMVYAGTTNDAIGLIRATAALNVMTGDSVTVASVTIGRPSAPYATGVVLARSETPAASDAGSPRRTSNVAQTATFFSVTGSAIFWRF